MSIFLCGLFAALVLLAVSLQKTYTAVLPKELKRRARQGDEFAKVLYRAVGYGPSLQVVLWLITGLTSAGFFLVAARVFPAWFALFLDAIIVWLAFYWIPTGHVTKLGLRVAGWLAPAFAWLLNYLHPVLDKLAAFARKHRHIQVHTGLYERADLLELLDKQMAQPGNRIEQAELQIARHALTFGDLCVRDVMVPRRVVKAVSAEEMVGPVLMAELHKSGFSRFPVCGDATDVIVGVLYLRDITDGKQSGSVSRHMRPHDICYIHEEQPLTEVLDVLLKTHRHLLIVVNSFEEYVGIVTIEDVLEQIVGQPVIDEFDQYEDMRAVAAKMARKEHAQHVAAQTESTQEATEVVE